MNTRFVGVMMGVITLSCILVGLVVYSHLPTSLVTHWDMTGRATGTMPRFWGVSLMPLIMIFSIVLWYVLPRIDPLAPGYTTFRYVYDFILFLTVAMFAYIDALLLGKNLGLPYSIPSLLFPALAMYIFTLGALLPAITRNWFIGVRTPWTISDDTVWNKTHRLASFLLQVSSVFILMAVFVPHLIALLFVGVPLISSVLISIIYSYYLSQKRVPRS